MLDFRLKLHTFSHLLTELRSITLLSTARPSHATFFVTTASFGRRYLGDGFLFGPVSALIQHRVPERVHRLLADPLVKLLRRAEREETRDRCLSLRFA